MTLNFLALATCVVVVAFLVMLLRTRRIKEKYAAAWLLLATAVCVVAAFPRALAWLASITGVSTPSNLLFAAALAVLFGVCIQLSVELSTAEEETRTLAEEIAMLRLDFERLGADPSWPEMGHIPEKED
ncbi:hypothetical protein SAMN05216410_0230 [Sanguibacter gelidistatuariae]|uniref:DUF2304 domain-containing protein n=1 Tax=Sanguibacter gelidistatuariae TaxID=1814289 RepID=A0A1G6XXB2_9MICO|nr:DUF2304 domain-containing protein [Sanguibacter gelidistatuariae]SDD82662.1 hypothetical protein SAMN05216410_0230 [Sanguibacter gelidistatuariae]